MSRENQPVTEYLPVYKVPDQKIYSNNTHSSVTNIEGQSLYKTMILALKAKWRLWTQFLFNKSANDIAYEQLNQSKEQLKGTVKQLTSIQADLQNLDMDIAFYKTELETLSTYYIKFDKQGDNAHKEEIVIRSEELDELLKRKIENRDLLESKINEMTSEFNEASAYLIKAGARLEVAEAKQKLNKVREDLNMNFNVSKSNIANLNKTLQIIEDRNKAADNNYLARKNLANRSSALAAALEGYEGQKPPRPTNMKSEIRLKLEKLSDERKEQETNQCSPQCTASKKEIALPQVKAVDTQPKPKLLSVNSLPTLQLPAAN